MARGVAASTSYTPGQSTLGSIKRDVLNYVQGTQDDSDLNAIAQTSINSAIDRINSRTWKKIVTSSTITLVADDDDYGLPADYKEPMVLLRNDTSGNRTGRISYKDLKTFYVERDSATQSGTPWYYSIHQKDRLLVLEMPPSTSFVTQHPTLTHWYFRRIPHLVSNSDTIDINPEFERFLVNYAASILAATRGHQVLSFVRQESELAWRELIRDDNETEPDWSSVVGF